MLNNTTRLYVSPLTPSLLPAVLGPSLTEVAQNISYHEIQTFPENSYGYVELPAAEAERLKKKLSGAILRGSKMKLEDARPKKRRRAEREDEAAQHASPARSKKPSTTRRKHSDTEAISGRQLTPERKVQRGWTEPAKEKKSKKVAEKTGKKSSKYTDKEEVLFRTKVPANKTDLPAKKPKKAKKARHGAEEHTVHEFEKTVTQPTFLKTQSSSSRANLAYVDGKGWLDESGEVVEAEPASARRKKHEEDSKPPKGSANGKQKASISKTGEVEAKAGTESDTDSNAISISSSDDDSEESTLSSAGVATPSAEQGLRADPKSGSEEVHPLESLFKKPQKPASQDVAKPSLEISTGFSFFGDNADDIEEELEVPLTPYSQDTRSRGLRSAAPTPDTAHPSRFNSYDSARFLGGEVTEEDEEDDGQEDDEGDARERSPKELRSASNTSAVTSDFEKLFWEKRGDNNRAWKGRRRAVLKEKRHRENRARRPKNW